MHRKMRDISSDLKERADLLAKQIEATQARFEAVITDIAQQRAIRRRRLETELRSVRNLIKIATVQQALHKALTSAVVSLDTVAKRPTSKKHLQEEKVESVWELDERTLPQKSPPEATSQLCASALLERSYPVAQILARPVGRAGECNGKRS